MKSLHKLFSRLLSQHIFNTSDYFAIGVSIGVYAPSASLYVCIPLFDLGQREAGYMKRAADYMKREPGYVKIAADYIRRATGYMKIVADYMRRVAGYMKRESGYMKRATDYM